MYAISTPADDQFASDGIAARGIAYGMPTIRVDGNDALAVHAAVKAAREMIVKDKKPALVEFISYRVGDHSTSDFSQRYRDEKEMKKWERLIADFSNPIQRLERFLVDKKWIGEDHQKTIRSAATQRVRTALKNASAEKLPSLDGLFTDVYEELTPDLKEQQEELREHLRKHPDAYNLEKFHKSEAFIQ